MKKTPRFDRKPRAIGNIRIQKRDTEIVKLVWEYRFLSSEQIQRLIAGSDQVILRRLQKLYHHGYLERPISQIVFSNPLFGPKKMVYGLGDKGADLMSEVYGIDRGNITWREKNKEVREKYILHTLMVSDFRACLTLSLKERPDTKLSWICGDTQALKQDVILTDGDKKKRLYIIPDGFFQIEDPVGTMYFFLEADRSTMTNARYYNKMRAYWLWWKQGLSKKLDMESFRVLTIAKTNQRMENLIKVTKQVYDSQKGSYMFWFSAIENCQLDQPEGVLKNIWLTPKDEVRHRLLE